VDFGLFRVTLHYRCSWRVGFGGGHGGSEGDAFEMVRF